MFGSSGRNILDGPSVLQVLAHPQFPGAGESEAASPLGRVQFYEPGEFRPAGGDGERGHDHVGRGMQVALRYSF
jgi:hypothetical protein